MGLDIQNHLHVQKAVEHLAQTLHTHAMHHNASTKSGVLTMFVVFFLTVISGFLVLWYLSLKQRQQQLAATIAQANIMLPSQPINIPTFLPPFSSGIASTQPSQMVDNQELCDITNFNDCFNSIATLFTGPAMSPLPPLSPLTLSTHQTVVQTPVPVILNRQVQTSTIQNVLPAAVAPIAVTTATTMSGIPTALTNSGAKIAVTQMSPIVIQPIPTQTSGIGAQLPIINQIRNSGISNPALADTLVKQLESSADLRGVPVIPINLPGPVISDGLTTPGNSILQTHMQMPMFYQQPYRSDGPDIPFAVSRILGPSPTAGQTTIKQTSPQSLPPHYTETGLRASGVLGGSPTKLAPALVNQPIVMPAVPLAPATVYPTLAGVPVPITPPPMFSSYMPAGYGIY